MKQVCLSIALIFSLLSDSFAQAKLKSITYQCNGKSTRAAVTNFEYLPQQTLMTSWSYYSGGVGITQPSKCLSVYNAKGQKTREKHNYWMYFGRSEAEMESETSFAYDARGCLLTEKTTEGSIGKSVFSIATTTYKRTPNCQLSQVIEAIEYSNTRFNGTVKDKITTYLYDNNDSLMRINYTFKDSINDLNFDKYERLPNGNLKTLLKQLVFQTSSGYEVQLQKLTYDYDSNGKLIRETQAYKYSKDPDFVVHNIRSYFYNSKGLLSRELVNYKINPSKCSDNETLYTYDCDNLLKEKVIKYVEAAYCQSEFNGKYIYAYTNVAPCELAVSDDIAVFPNPTTGLFTIESPVLRNGDWRVKIVGSDGKI